MYWVQRHDNLFLQMLYFDNYVVCNIISDHVYKIITPCFVKIENIAKLPLHKHNKPIVPLSQKSPTHTQSEVTLPPSKQTCGEKVGVSHYEVYNSGNLPHIPKLTTSSQVHPHTKFLIVILEMPIHLREYLLELVDTWIPSFHWQCANGINCQVI